MQSVFVALPNLSSFFFFSFLQSAMNHDVIMNAHDEEKVRLEEQAAQVAQRAAEALRQSRMLRNRESIATPTWTGKSGTAGAPSSVRRKFGSTVNPLLINSSEPSDEHPSNRASKLNGIAAGASAGKTLSSAELLARIRGNKERAADAGTDHHESVSSSSINRGTSLDVGPSGSSHNLGGMQPEVLIRQICTFLQQRGGRTSSASIVNHFKDRIPTKDLSLFKNLLKEIATLEKNPNGSVWVLNPEYQ